MESFHQKIRMLISNGKTKKALQEFLDYAQKSGDNELVNEVTAMQGKFKQGQRDYRMGVVSNNEWGTIQAQVANGMLQLLEDLPEESEAQPVEHPPRKSSKKVFISYNHNDRQAAEKIKAALEQEGHQVIIDYESMPAGMDIQQFIEVSVEKSDVTLSLVSEKSLMSGWVAMETVNTLNLAKFQQNKKFIACYLDNEFFKPDFRLRVTDKIDEKLKELNKLVDQYRERNIEPTDLYSERERLAELRHNLGKILEKLRNSKSLDMTDAQFEKNLPVLLKAINS